MDPTYDSEGFLQKVQGRFGYGRDVCLTTWQGQAWVHIFDSSKCRQQNESYDKTKKKSISFKWADALILKDCIGQLEAYAQQIEGEQVRLLFYFFILFKTYLFSFVIHT